MKHLNLVLSFLFTLSLSSLSAQSYSDIANQKTGNIRLEPSSIIGLWEVTQVTVSIDTMTPKAKWFEFLTDGTLSSGNGWLQNYLGSFNYDEDTQELLQASQGVVDEYGAFQIKIVDKSMTWQRTEEGQPVKISLIRASKKPLGPWDLLVGRWTIEKAEGLNPETGAVLSEYSMRPEAYIFRWDREYRKLNESYETSETGIWQIGAHFSELSIISNEGKSTVKWVLEFIDDQMIWIQKGDTETMKVYFKRIEN
ncbi:MAG: hypothetical protein ACJAVN_000216 [Roseivirga sp.]|jgi:hypothetical protein